MLQKSFLSLLILLCCCNAQAEIIEQEYSQFKLWVDCEQRGSVMFKYTLTKGLNSHRKFYSPFLLSHDFKETCKQKSADPYFTKKNPHYLRGTGVPENHVNNSQLAADEVKYMMNVWPTHKDLHTGALAKIESIANCYRKMSPLTMYGGIISGASPANNDFLETHGVMTPSYFWRVIIRGDKALAWILSNKENSPSISVNNGLVSVHDLEKLINYRFDIPESSKTNAPSRAWVIPHGCGVS